MEQREKAALLDKFDNAYDLLVDLVKGQEPVALAFVPDLEGAWSINDQLVHLLDAEVSTFFRLRLALAEPGTRIQPWDEEAWHDKLDYGALDGRACLAQAITLRHTAATYLRAHLQEEWSAYWLDHPARGRLSVEDILVIYRDHLAFHAPLIKRNLEAYRQRS